MTITRITEVNPDLNKFSFEVVGENDEGKPIQIIVTHKMLVKMFNDFLERGMKEMETVPL